MKFSELRVSTDWRGGTCPYAAVASETDDLEHRGDDWLQEMRRTASWGMHFQMDADIIAFMRPFAQREEWEKLYAALAPFLAMHSRENRKSYPPGKLRRDFFYFARMRQGHRIVAARGTTYYMVGVVSSNELVSSPNSRFPYQRNVDWRIYKPEGWAAPVRPGRTFPDGHMTTIAPLCDPIYAAHLARKLAEDRDSASHLARSC